MYIGHKALEGREMTGPELLLGCSMALLALGLYGLAVKRNLIRLIIALEILSLIHI